ncbi:hypothetical protein [Micromonospora sp. AMSO31t]|uniref:hypothetical protein n=1 Tax=Micromonospora sp. AMSO31t TaxID=2650566 RepID=UPI001CED51C3|nr:hypothetical protein [Micromonospora sp. AMSO31t]
MADPTEALASAAVGVPGTSEVPPHADAASSVAATTTQSPNRRPINAASHLMIFVER